MKMTGDWGENSSVNREKFQYNDERPVPPEVDEGPVDLQRGVNPAITAGVGDQYVHDHGLDLNMATYRMLDPSIGRWYSVDPKSELMFGYTPLQLG